MGIWSTLFGGRKEEGAAVRETFGYDTTDPILCCLPAGERELLERLRCPAGHRFTYRRMWSIQGTCPDAARHLDAFPDEETFRAKWQEMQGKAGPCEPSQPCLLDAYALVCTGGEHSCVLYFDMYHLERPAQPAPAGLSLV